MCVPHFCCPWKWHTRHFDISCTVIWTGMCRSTVNVAHDSHVYISHRMAQLWRALVSMCRGSMSSHHGTNIHSQMTCTECILISEVMCKGALLSALVKHMVCFQSLSQKLSGRVKLMFGQHFVTQLVLSCPSLYHTSATVSDFNPYSFATNTLCSNLLYIQSIWKTS